ncbi:F0F1 ATP synthase subunit epsilon [Sedimenticola hydrogenitrophicus]|uniref:F0F1 ATP synthase subunit epsilon n=1 Tax=Sedimenticola hydrogenitrophicus TaxID=2967975 RepID=UPI0023AEDC03|nr:F0F1 ATP synthase subunit epsilon [Sedimenticola hydrogenitrophicus]
MSGFSIQLQSATQSERLDRMVSFVGEDASGSFGLMRGHARFVTTLVFGLARLRFDDGRREYLALPEAVASFDNDQLTISTRRYLRSGDFSRISQALRQELLQEEVILTGFRRSIGQLEQTMMLRLWRIGRGEGRGG